MKTRLLPAIAAFIFLVAVSAAPGAADPDFPKPGSPKSYAPKKGKKCKRGYRSVKRKGKRVCVKRKKLAKRTPQAIVPNLHVHLGPTFKRDPLNPFKVTYSYSASATRDATPPATGQVPTALPSGVLAFYGDGKLECAINVGGQANSGECPVVYQELGQHRVTTIFSSGERSVTATETQQIDPLATTTMMSASFVPSGASEIDLGNVGTLELSAGAQPVGVPHVGCNQSDPATCIDYVPSFLSGSGGPHTGYTFPLAGSTQYEVWVRDARFGVCFNQPHWEITARRENGDALALGGNTGFVGPHSRWYSLADIGTDLALGSRHLMARTNAGAGYVSSSATAPVQFTPPLPADPCAEDYGSLDFTYEDFPDPPVYETNQWTEVGTVRVERDPASMAVFCTEGQAIAMSSPCIPNGVEELVVSASPPFASDCGQLTFEPADPETELGPTFTRPRAEVEAGAADFYGRGGSKWATGMMQFAPTLPPECEP